MGKRASQQLISRYKEQEFLNWFEDRPLDDTTIQQFLYYHSVKIADSGSLNEVFAGQDIFVVIEKSPTINKFR